MKVGDRVGSYIIERLADEGPITDLYRVRQASTGWILTLKVLKLRDAEAKARVLQEGRALSSFSHPNLVTVTEIVETETLTALVMDYVDGPDLYEWIEQDHPLRARLDVFEGVCEGVAEAHRHGLVHRNLQPANVHLESTREGWVPKVVDFALAKHVREHAGFQTSVGSLFGTLGYIAPEQLHETASVGRRADIYSLGCLLYLLVCEAEPFEAETETQLIADIMANRFKHPREHVPALDEAIERAITGAMEEEPLHRIPDATILLRVLRGAAWPPLEEDTEIVDATALRAQLAKDRDA